MQLLLIYMIYIISSNRVINFTFTLSLMFKGNIYVLLIASTVSEAYLWHQFVYRWVCLQKFNSIKMFAQQLLDPNIFQSHAKYLCGEGITEYMFLKGNIVMAHLHQDKLLTHQFLLL